MIDFKLKYIRLLKKVYNYSLKFLFWLNPAGPKVYLFHHITESVDQVENQNTLSYLSFARFLDNQIAKGAQPFSFGDLSEYINGNKKNVINRFAISFDDVYESAYTKAYPLLKEMNIPFILFVTTGLLDKPKYLSKQQLISISMDPLCTIGSHGCNHVLFRKLSIKEVDTEYRESKAFLESLINKPVEVFAFPYGNVVAVSGKNVKYLWKTSYKFAFSALTGSLQQQWFTSRFFLPRVNVDEAYVNQK